MLETLQQLLTLDLNGVPTIALFFIFFFGTFVSEDAACLAAGGAAAAGEISFTFAVFSCFLGILTGDILLYWIGRIFGARLLAFPIASRFVSDRSITRASAWLETRGASAVFLSRFVTGLRLPTYLAAGFLKADFPKFVLYFLLASVIWTPILVGSVVFADRVATGNLIIAGVLAFVLIRIATRLSNWRSRRMLVGRIRRIMNWEFWPLGVFYFPVVCYVLLLAIRHRSLTVFTCANPSIPSGGFVGESKDEIYSLLSRSPKNQKFMLRHRKLDGSLSFEARMLAADSFIERHELRFPIVLKPDAGERGKGVRIIRSREDLETELRDARGDQLVQEFYEGDEVSIFYYRMPPHARGEIFSITKKKFPFVVGDGASTLEELILNDRRAVCLAEKYFDENTESLDRVIRRGEQFPIIAVGTHSRGAIFLDGSDLLTDALRDSIDELCRRIDGFYFGRFDIRFSSLEDFQAGREFKIIELNGVTSESTNIYDPRYSLLDAYRILFAQWRLAFEIGVENRKLGAPVTPVIDLCRSVLCA